MIPIPISVGTGGAGQAIAWPLSWAATINESAVNYDVVTPTTDVCNRDHFLASWRMHAICIELKHSLCGDVHSTAKLLNHFITTWPDHSNFASYSFNTTTVAVFTHTFFRFAVEENSQYMHTINTLEPNAWMHKVWTYTGFHQLVFAVIFFLPTGFFIWTWNPEGTVSEYKWEVGTVPSHANSKYCVAWLFNHRVFLGCIQTGETVIMSDLLWYGRLIAEGNLRGSCTVHLATIIHYANNPHDQNICEGVITSCSKELPLHAVNVSRWFPHAEIHCVCCGWRMNWEAASQVALCNLALILK